MNFLQDFFFPNRCMGCNRIIGSDDLVCEICFGNIHFTHFDFDENNLLKERCKLLFPVENAFALMQFEKDESLSRDIIHQLKYENRENIGKILAKWTVEKINFKTEKPNLLATIPLHPKKLKKRGYNQLHLFAETLSEHWKIPINHTILKRNIYAKAQAKRKIEERGKTQNQFSATETVSDKHILLTDDVFTTGNTMSAAVWEILKSGNNNKVSVLVMAVEY
ncbi:MAG: ComF family protein [Flavobacteriaceae bacterium]|nr:ComF family protein [Flavobacteriaceae bacterium]